jgi:hypothetical protein
MAAATANAQEFGSGLVIQPVVPQDFSRGHNVSVQEQPRPDYAALGVTLGGFILYPRVEIGSGATTNTYLTSNEAITSPFLYETASGRLASRWARHELRILASTTHREYIGESRRNEHLWNVDVYGRIDAHSSIKVEANVNASQNFENLFSGEVAANVAALSQYQRNFVSVRSTYSEGSTRAFAVVDYTKFNFSTVPLRGGGNQDQNFRDREILGLSGQFEYARSPSVAFFAQVSGRKTSFNRPLPTGQPSVSSQSARILGGVNVDIAGKWRGSIGVGYIIRDYESGSYKTRRGIAAEVRTDLFLTQRLTLGITARRTIEDITVGVPTPSFNNTASARIDYELLRNLILSATGEFLRQSGRNETYRLTAGSRFLASRRFNVQGLLSYSQRSPDMLREARIEATIAYQL